MNGEYRLVKPEELKAGLRVFCYYLTPKPSPATLGTVLTDPDREGWVEVQTDNGEMHNFDAQRLGVLRD